ncbi:rRNA maturation RNase YbeY [Candidatus Phytoplasma sacchari]|uniref:Endoribonuclease YbeY n=1 Tax=Candidatus Phytoplasma sacchari TaxID=2609813 RepID=A0ABY7M1Y3_9MOLU|nr:rRNA maturation RNase YbeY [Candidatus Phytoplasma sacchari]
MIINIHNKSRIKINYIKKKLIKLFDYIVDNKKVHIIFIENKKMKEMNFYYRNKNKPTDILTFTNEVKDDSLGDIFISLTEALRQSEEYNYDFLKEICFLCLHGYLHLKGYEDTNEKKLNDMINMQNKILNIYF